MTFNINSPSILVDEIREIYEPSSKEVLPYIGLEHINKNSLTINGFGKSSDTQSSKKKFRKGDILFGTLRPYFRKVVILDFDGVCSTDIAVLRAKTKADYYFVKYFIAHQNFIDFAYANSNGTRMPRANWKQLSKSEWPIPDNKTRFKIGYVLDSYDKLIENNIRRIKILEEMAQRIYKHWFVDFKYPSYENNKLVDSKLGMIPQGWKVKSIVDIPYFRFIKENIVEFDGFKTYFATADVQGTWFVKDGIKYKYHNRPSRAQKQPIVNSIWFARMKDSHKIAIYTMTNKKDAESSILSSGFAGFQSDEKYFGYLYAIISSKDFETLKNLYATGATQVSLNNDGLKRILFPLPTEKLIIDFNSIVKPLIEQSILLKSKNVNLKKTRDYLLPKLISGKVDVSGLDIDTSILGD